MHVIYSHHHWDHRLGRRGVRRHGAHRRPRKRCSRTWPCRPPARRCRRTSRAQDTNGNGRIEASSRRRPPSRRSSSSTTRTRTARLSGAEVHARSAGVGASARPDVSRSDHADPTGRQARGSPAAPDAARGRQHHRPLRGRRQRAVRLGLDHLSAACAVRRRRRPARRDRAAVQAGRARLRALRLQPRRAGHEGQRGVRTSSLARTCRRGRAGRSRRARRSSRRRPASRWTPTRTGSSTAQQRLGKRSQHLPRSRPAVYRAVGYASATRPVAGVSSLSSSAELHRARVSPLPAGGEVHPDSTSRAASRSHCAARRLGRSA